MTVHFKPATEAQIEDAILPLVGSMPPPKGVDGSMQLQGYVRALRGFPINAIEEAVDGFFDGRFREQFSTKYCPTPPDMAAMVRKCETKPSERGGSAYAMSMPASQILETNITREFARRLCQEGRHPRGCIWLPGTDQKAEIGTLFAPDDNWRGAVRVKSSDELKEEEARQTERAEAVKLTFQELQKLQAYRDGKIRFDALKRMPTAQVRAAYSGPSPAARVTEETEAKRGRA